MRIIKFRGRRVDNGEWVEGYLFSYGINSFIVGEKDFICYENNSTAPTICELRTFGNRVIPETVGQFTGLKDKHDNEIFEGDIVNMHYFFENYHPSSLGIFEDEKEIIGTVGIDECGTYTESDSEIYYWFNYLQDPSEELEVIGNIYENQN